MLRIGEFSELSSISINMLRHYDKIGLLIPQHIDDTNGYRYYDKAQLVQANEIILLKSMSFSLSEIKEIITKGENNVNKFLEEKLQEKNNELQNIKMQITQINSILKLDSKVEKYALKIARKHIKSSWMVSLCGEIDTYPQEGIMWKRITKECVNNNVNIPSDSLAFAICRGINEESGKIQVEVRFSIDKCYKVKEPLKIFKKNDEEVVSVMFKGDYSQISLINTTIAEWIEKNNLVISGEKFTIYHKSPGNCSDNTEFITEMCFPVKDKS